MLGKLKWFIQYDFYNFKTFLVVLLQDTKLTERLKTVQYDLNEVDCWFKKMLFLGKY